MNEHSEEPLPTDVDDYGRRQFGSSDETVTLYKVPNLLAVELANPPSDPDAEALRRIVEEYDLGRFADESAAAERTPFYPFVRAGWVFVEPNARVRRALESREYPEGTVYVERVFWTEGGDVVVGTDRLTVRLVDPVAFEDDPEDWLSNRGLTAVGRLLEATFEVQVAPGADVFETVERMRQQEEVVYAEPTLLEHIEERREAGDRERTWRPSDPGYDSQWQWFNDGSDGGTAGADVDAESAWKLCSQRGRGVTIAHVDSGLDPDHPDIEPALTPNAGVFRDVGGGRVEFELTTGSGTPENGRPDHGTMCVGLAVARANNDVAGCGVAPEADLLPVTCVPSGIGTQETIARALVYAADPATEPEAEAAGFGGDDGADVVSLSLGLAARFAREQESREWRGRKRTMPKTRRVLSDAIDYVVERGRSGTRAPLFCAVGNRRRTIDGETGYDPVCAHERTIAVGRSDRRDRVPRECAYGPQLDFVAPGNDVYSTKSGGEFGPGSGTSYATPIAAGIAALVLSLPLGRDRTATDVRRFLREGCEKVGNVAYDGGHDERYGHGRVDAYGAVLAAVREAGLLPASDEASDDRAENVPLVVVDEDAVYVNGVRIEKKRRRLPRRDE
jgi:thermitase